jgi:ATP-dependent helicase/nuclease subunit B
MHIVFGWELDGHSYPPTSTGCVAAIGQPVVGPTGLLNLLEVSLGLAGPTTPAAVRIARYQGRLRMLDDGRQFYSQSFARDAWATAKQVLAWRDELCAAGWTGTPIVGGGLRLEALAKIETISAQALGKNIGERLQAVLTSLCNVDDLDIDRVDVISPESMLPPIWQKLLAQLRNVGVSVRALQERCAAEGNDLAAVQRALLGKGLSQFAGDGSFVFLDAEDEWQAADAVASWLAASDNSATVIVRGSGSIALDEACSRQGLPRPGRTEASPLRSALQVLPLALEIIWNPLDPTRLLEFLSLPQSPLPRSVSRRFVRTLVEQPGIGNPRWLAAWEESIEQLAQRQSAYGLDAIALRKEVDNARQAWRFWLEPERFDRSEGIPSSRAQEVCQRIAQWSAGIASRDDDPLFFAAASNASALSEAIAALGVERIPAIQLGRMVDAVTAAGHSAPTATGEAAPWSVVDQSCQICGPAESVVWWSFCGEVSPPSRHPWASKELAALAAGGAQIESVEDSFLREAAGWRQAILSARSRVILVAPRRIAGEPTAPHPLWHEISAKLESARAVQRSIFSARSIAGAAEVRVLGRVLKRCAVASSPLPAPQRRWTVRPSTVRRRETESITSIKQLIECPLAWALKYGAHISAGALNVLPNDDKLIGTVAHAIVERIFEQRNAWRPDEAANEASRLFDELAVELAAPLLRVGNSVEYQRAKVGVVDAIRQFVIMMSKAGLTMRSCEQEIEVPFEPGQKFRGFLDLALEDARGNSAIIDLKWSKQDRYRRQEVKDGRALQLAAYAWLEEQSGRHSMGAGYFMMRQQTLLFTEPVPFSEANHVPGSDLQQTWRDLRQAYAQRMAEVEAGELIVKGVPADEEDADVDPMPQIEAGCRFCDYRPLCGAPNGGHS